MKHTIISCLTSVSTLLFGHCIADEVTAREGIELHWQLSLNANESDLSERNDILEDGTPHNRLGGFSAMTYDEHKGLYWVLPDRGPKDGATGYLNRIHQMSLQVDDNGHASARLQQTTMLCDQVGRSFTGSLEQVPHQTSPRGLAFDPEGVRVLPEGNLLISDEYGPFIDAFGSDGRLLQSWRIPDNLRLPRNEKSEGSVVGAATNRGLEGIAITPSGQTIVGAFQGPLRQDAELVDDKYLGDYARLVVFNAQAPSDCVRQIAYRLESPTAGISEILAVDEHRFLVLERDSLAAKQSNLKKIFLIDISHATDVSELEKLPVSGDLPGAHRTAAKQLFIDILDQKFGMQEANGLEKIEGMTWGPRLRDGRRQLVLCTDNDFDASRDSLIFSYAIHDSFFDPSSGKTESHK